MREELQNYGEMLALLDRQQEQVKARSAAEIFQSISLIQAQAAAIQGARQQRDDCRPPPPWTAASPNAPFADLIPCCPPITARCCGRWWMKTINCWCGFASAPGKTMSCCAGRSN